MPILASLGVGSIGSYVRFRRSAALSSDPYFNLVTLLLPGNGTNGAQNNTFLDSSNNNFTITRNGNATQGTFSPFSQTGWGYYFPGSSSYLNFGIQDSLQLNSENFTIEFWMHPSSNAASAGMVCGTWRNGTAYTYGIFRGSNVISFSYSTDGTYQSANDGAVRATLDIGRWNHLAYVRSGNTLTLYKNGVQASTATVGTFAPYTQSFWMGRNDNDQQTLVDTTISNFRFVKGTAVYTSNFTPSTTPLTAIANTVLLTCQSNRFVDNSNNAFSILRNGTPSVQAFGPFSTAEYNASTVGGSGYFDGTGDWLQIADNSAFNLGTFNYTMEFWTYPTSFAAQGVPFAYQWDSNGGTRLIVFAQNTNGTYLVYVLDTSASITSTNTVQLNAWNHIALVRTGSTFTLYLNGVASGTTTYGSGYPDSDLPVTIGASWNGTTGVAPYVGYISNARVVIGTAIYTTNFTPPTAPLTAVDGTRLLANFTNAGITDATAKNVLETVGNAQISTAQSQFGGSSMLFDGTGDYISAPGSPLWLNGSGDWTIEGWIYLSSTPATNGFYIYGQDSGAAAIRTMSIVYNNSTAGSWKIWATSSGSSWDIANDVTFGSFTLATSTWYHFAVVRNGTNLKLYIDGTAQGSGSTISGSIQTNTSFNFNAFGQFQNLSGSGGFPGYIDDYRITKGYARYTANFTPPASAFPLQ